MRVIEMKKPKENKNRIGTGVKFLSARRKGVVPQFLSALFLILMASSCGKGGNVSENGGNAGVSPPPGPPAAVNRELVLLRGNLWASGIPGFGVNRFSALTGEYRFADPSNQTSGEKDSGGEREFSVYLTMEPLYFSGGWQKRPDTGEIQVFQYTGEEGFLAATVLEASRDAPGFPRGVPWTAVFRFPTGLEEAGFSENVFTQMLSAWIGRFSYYLFLANTPGEVSLPAVVDF